MAGTNRRFFIGDVHGHYDGLMRLLDAIAPSEDDQIYFVGDLIDRGPKSAKVVNFVRDGGYPCVLGNHEQLLIDAFPNGTAAHMPTLQGWLYSGGQATLASYGNIEALLGHLEWFRSLPLYLDLGPVWLVHAGVHPGLAIADQTFNEFCWIRETFHSIPKPYFDDKVIITGHTITFTLPSVEPGQVAAGQGWLDIDTGAYHPKSGWLTALDYDNQQVYQVNVFSQQSRIRPLEDATAQIDPSQIRPRQRQQVPR